MRLITGDVNLRVRLYISNSRCFCCLQLNVVSLLIDSLGTILKINMGSHLIHMKVRCTYRTRDEHNCNTRPGSIATKKAD